MNRILGIVNPISGGTDKQTIVRLLRESLGPESGLDIRFTEGPGDATRIARETEADTVLAIGGDGTVAEVAAGLLDSNKTLGIIPCGSGNGLALHLGISRHPGKAVETLKNGRIERIDCGMLGDRPFFCTAGIGFDAEVAWRFAHADSRGLKTYITEALHCWSHYRPCQYTLDMDGRTETLTAVIITIGNANQWGNNARITPLASVQDGLLDITVVAPFHTAEIPLLAAQLMDGHAYNNRRARHFRCKSVSIIREEEGPAHFDGEPCRLGKEIRIQIRPSALRVIVPPDSII